MARAAADDLDLDSEECVCLLLSFFCFAIYLKACVCMCALSLVPPCRDNPFFVHFGTTLAGRSSLLVFRFLSFLYDSGDLIEIRRAGVRNLNLHCKLSWSALVPIAAVYGFRGKVNVS